MEAPNLNIEIFKVEVSKIPEILMANDDSVSKALAYGNQLLIEIENLKKLENGIPNFEARKVLDVKLNDYLLKIDKTGKVIKERRTPKTGFFDDLKKMFTSLESKIDPKSTGTLPNLIVNTRNQYATDYAKEIQRKAQELEKHRNRESEKIRVKSEIELQLKKHFLQFVDQEQTEYTKKFEGLKLVAFDFGAEHLKNYTPEYSIMHFESFKPVVNVFHINSDEIQSIMAEVKPVKFKEFVEEFRETMLGIKEIVVERLESKRTELQEIANAADLEEKKFLENEAAKRQKEQADKLALESQQKVQVVEQAATVQQETAKANLLFDMVSVGENQKVKESTEILVTSAAGWLQIVAFYFEKEGFKKIPDELGKMKLEQMKNFCEKFYAKNGTKVTHPGVEYKDVYKAVKK